MRNTASTRAAYVNRHRAKRWRAPLALFCVLVALPVIVMAFTVRYAWNICWASIALLVSACATVAIVFRLLRLEKNVHTLSARARRLQEAQGMYPETMEDLEVIGEALRQCDDYLQRDIADQLSLRGLELDAWQHQINPHFLYNTLETIRSQALEDNSLQSAEMIELLGRILRYSLNKHSNLCTIDQELTCVDSYFRIQQSRFENRFQLIVSIEENDFFLHRYKLPRLTLQPLIENAIYHGLESKIGMGCIRLELQRTKENILISVIDDGVGIAPDRLREINVELRSFNYKQKLSSAQHSSFGLALQNINARIKLVYGREYGITVLSDVDMGTQVMILLPVEVPCEE